MSTAWDEVRRCSTALGFPGAYFVAAWGVLVASILAALLVDASGYGPLWLAMVLLGVAVFLGIRVPIWTTEIGVTN